jgi:hypothetical protein
MSPPNASNDELAEASPPPPPPPLPPLTPHRRQASVRLSQGWIDAVEELPNGSIPEIATDISGSNDNNMPVSLVAFFPLPAEEDTVPPSPQSPRSKRVSVPGTTPGTVIELALPDLPVGIDSTKDKEDRLTEGERTSTQADQDTDAAAAAVTDFISDESFSSVGTVASREFSEGMGK